MQVQMNLPDVATGEQIGILYGLLQEINRKLDRLQPPQFIGDWLNGTDFCKKYSISRPTLYRKVESGLVEIQTLDGIKRYRMKE